MKISIQLTEKFNVPPSIIYNAWLNSEKHTEMTGGTAHCTDLVGDVFTAWNRYITGKNIHLIPNEKIVQSWRTSEFKEEDEDSELIIHLKEMEDGTELTLIHTNIPEGQTEYEQGWVDNYFIPMKAYFKY